MSKSFYIKIDLSFSANVEELWPEDAPAHPSAADAAESLGRSGSLRDLINEFSLLDDVVVTVDGVRVVWR